MCQVFRNQDPASYRAETRAIRLHGQMTWIRVEAAFWAILEEIAERVGLTVPQFTNTLYAKVAACHLSQLPEQPGPLRRACHGLTKNSAGRLTDDSRILSAGAGTPWHPGMNGHPQSPWLARHSMLRMRNEAVSLAFYRLALGPEVADRYPFDAFTLIYLRNAEQDFELELTVNGDRTEPYQLGDGYGHLAVSVPDVEAEHARFEAAWLKPLSVKTLAHEGRTLGSIFFVPDPDGYRIEVLQRGGRFIQPQPQHLQTASARPAQRGAQHRRETKP